MRPLKFPLAALAAVLFALGAVSAHGQQPLKVRVAWIVPIANIASILFAKEGVARHLGKTYTMELVHFQGTTPMVTAIATGEIEIALLGFSSLPLAIQNAKLEDLRIIADELQDGTGNYYSNEFMVLKDSPIRSAADLKGKVLATNAAGSAVDIAMRAMLKKAGLDDKKDVTVVEANFPNMKAMLLEKKVDLIPAVLPFSADPQLRAAARTLFTQKDGMGTSLGIWVARAAFLQKNRAAMVDFMEDYLRSVQWYLNPANNKEAVEIAAKFTKRPAAGFEGWLFTGKDYYRDPAGMLNVGALQSNFETLGALGFMPAPLDARNTST